MSSPQRPVPPESCGREDATSKWATLGGEDIALIKETVSREPVASGHPLFVQGEPVTGMVCLLSGSVAVHRKHGEGQSTLLRLLDSGSALGLDALFGSGVHSNSAVALTNCEILRVPPEKLCELMAKSPEFMRKIFGRLAFDLQAADEARVNGVHMQVRARLAALLLALRDRHGSVDEEGNLLITLPLSRRDMASAIGTRPESLSRAIRALETAKVASFSGKQVVVRDLDDLLDEVEQG